MKISGFGELENLKKSINPETPPTTKKQREEVTQLPAAATDEVEVSQQAKLLGQLSQLPDIRSEKIDIIKAEIKTGNHLTPERLRSAVSKLITDI